MDMKKQVLAKLFAKHDAVTSDVSFKHVWSSEHGSIRNMVVNINHRLILNHGEWRRCADSFGRKIVALGTHYGLIVMYQADVGENSFVRMDVTNELVRRNIVLRATVDRVDLKTINEIFSNEFLAKIERIAQEAEDRNGEFPNDGLPMFAPNPSYNKKPTNNFPQGKKPFVKEQRSAKSVVVFDPFHVSASKKKYQQGNKNNHLAQQNQPPAVNTVVEEVNPVLPVNDVVVVETISEETTMEVVVDSVEETPPESMSEEEVAAAIAMELAVVAEVESNEADENAVSDGEFHEPQIDDTRLPETLEGW